MAKNINDRPDLGWQPGKTSLLAPLLLGAALYLTQTAGAAIIDNWGVEGANGSLYVTGVLTESACQLEMESVYQTVSLGEIGTGRLAQVGNRGTPVGFTMRLTDCLASPSGSRDLRTGGLTWGGDQLAVAVRFSAPRDADNPQLVKVQGVSGLGLRMLDGHGRDVRLGDRGVPLALTTGQNALTYTVAPERTAARLMSGSYRAVVDFQLSYD